jgi:hypothetical protein
MRVLVELGDGEVMLLLMAGIGILAGIFVVLNHACVIIAAVCTAFFARMWPINRRILNIQMFLKYLIYQKCSAARSRTALVQDAT